MRLLDLIRPEPWEEPNPVGFNWCPATLVMTFVAPAVALLLMLLEGGIRIVLPHSFLDPDVPSGHVFLLVMVSILLAMMLLGVVAAIVRMTWAVVVDARTLTTNEEPGTRSSWTQALPSRG
jgi:hypothetical protein